MSMTEEREAQRAELVAVWGLDWQPWINRRAEAYSEWEAEYGTATVDVWRAWYGGFYASVELHVDAPSVLASLDGISASGDSHADAVRALRAAVEAIIADHRAQADALAAWLGDACTGDGGPSDDCDGEGGS